MRPRVRFSKILTILFIIIFLVAINTTSFRETLRVSVFDASERFITTVHFFFYHFTSGVSKLGESVDIYKERDKLRHEVAQLKAHLLQYEEARLENERLRALLQFQKENALQGTTAMVIGRDMQAASQVLMINKGKKNNVDVGTVLINHDGLVGHVIRAGDEHAKVLSILDTKARVCAMVQGTRNAGIIEGTPTHLLKLKHLDINATVKIGDRVITSGFGDIFPKGLPIGVVEMIGTEADNLHLYALVKPFVNFSKLEEVLCLQKESSL